VGFQVYIVLNTFKLNFDWRLARSMLVFIAGILAIGWFSTGISDSQLSNMLLMWAFALLWAFITRMLSMRMMFALLRQHN